MTQKEEQLRRALQRMLDLHDRMMKQTNHGASHFDARTIQEMNEAPSEARKAME